MHATFRSAFSAAQPRPQPRPLPLPLPQPAQCPTPAVFRSAKRFRHTSNLYPTYLAQDVKGVGKEGDIVLLRAGYARNFIAGTGKGLVIPRDQRAFAKHQDVYRLLGFPVPTILQYYDGSIQAKTKGESWRSSQLDDAFSSDAAAAKSGPSSGTSVASLIAARSEVAKALRASLTSAPIRLLSSADPRGALYGSITPSNVVDELEKRGIKGLALVLKQHDQIAFFDAELGKIRKIKQVGKYKATMSVPMVGAVDFEVEVVGTAQIVTEKLMAKEEGKREAAAAAAAGASLAEEVAGESVAAAARAPPAAAPASEGAESAEKVVGEPAKQQQ